MLSRTADGVPLLFERRKEEDFVLYDRSAERRAELLEGHARFIARGWIAAARRIRIHIRVEVIAGVERIAAAIGVRAAVQGVGAGLDSDADDGARLPSVLRGRVDFSLEFLDR